MISVIVPAYNAEKYLSRTLDSLLAQTVSGLEIIVVDDGSEDGTGEIAERYAGLYPDRVTVIRTENGGVTRARLIGVGGARGEYIGFSDSDDIAEKDMFALLLGNLEKYGADISHCGYRMVFPDGRVNEFYGSKKRLVQDRTEALGYLLDGKVFEPSLCTKLFKKELFSDLKIDESIRFNEDLLMNFILFSRAERSVFEDVCKYSYIVRGDSASRSDLVSDRLSDPIKVRKAIVGMNVPGVGSEARKTYISTCINVRNCIALDGTNRFEKEKAETEKEIRESKSLFPLLGRKQRLLARLILAFPGGYDGIYRFYARHFMKNRYE